MKNLSILLDFQVVESISVIRDLKTLRHGRPQVRDFLNSTLKQCTCKNQLSFWQENMIAFAILLRVLVGMS